MGKIIYLILSSMAVSQLDEKSYRKAMWVMLSAIIFAFITAVVLHEVM